MSTPGFPFIGAGDASYFEWAEVHVCFTRAPSKAEAAAIGKGVPPPLRDTIEWRGPLLWVASEQGVGRQITAAYKKSSAAEGRFNADIDAWLIAAHASVPILIAYRREDHEAGGTKLSDWHRASVPAIPDAIAALTQLEEVEAAKLGTRLASAAKEARIAIAPEVVARLEARVAAAEAADAAARARAWEATKANANAALGAPAPRFDETRTDLDTKPLATLLPATAKRLQRLGAKGVTLRPGATAAALAAVEQALGVELTPPHRALLTVCDGGQLGEITVLGTAMGGARGDAELATFTNAWCGERPRYTIVAHTGRDNVIAIPRDRPGPVFLFWGAPGSNGGRITRQCKSLDIALDLAIKAGRVWNNQAG